MVDNGRRMRLYACLPFTTVGQIRATGAYVGTLNRHPFWGKRRFGWICLGVDAIDDRLQRTEVRALFAAAPPPDALWDGEKWLVTSCRLYESRDWHIFDGFSRSRRRARRLAHA